jgi:hypothetical protein
MRVQEHDSRWEEPVLVRWDVNNITASSLLRRDGGRALEQEIGAGMGCKMCLG